MTDTQDNTHVSLVMAKTKVAPIKRQTIPRLELCGAHLSSYVMLKRSSCTILLHDRQYLCWLNGNPRRFKTFVGNRIS